MHPPLSATAELVQQLRVDLVPMYSQFLTSLGQIGPDLAYQGELNFPVGVFAHLDPETRQTYLLVADNGNNRLLVFRHSDGGGLSLARVISEGDLLQSPVGVAVDPSTNNIFVSCIGNHQVWAFDWRGELLFSVNDRSGQKFSHPLGLCIDFEGRLFVCDDSNHVVKVFSAADGRFLHQFGGEGIDDGQYRHPVDVAMLYRVAFADTEEVVHTNLTGLHQLRSRVPQDQLRAVTQLVLVVDCDSRCIQCFSPEGMFLRKFEHLLEGDTSWKFLCVNSRGRIIATCVNLPAVHVFDADGQFLYALSTTFEAPLGVAVDTRDTLFIVDHNAGKLHHF